MNIQYYLCSHSVPSMTRALLLLSMMLSGFAMLIVISAYKNDDIEEFSTALTWMTFLMLYLLSTMFGLLGLKKNVPVLLVPHIICRILWILVITAVLMRATALEFPKDVYFKATVKSLYQWLSQDLLNFTDKLRNLLGAALEIYFTRIVILCHGLLEQTKGDGLIMGAHFDGCETVNLIRNGAYISPPNVPEAIQPQCQNKVYRHSYSIFSSNFRCPHIDFNLKDRMAHTKMVTCTAFIYNSILFRTFLASAALKLILYKYFKYKPGNDNGRCVHSIENV